VPTGEDCERVPRLFAVLGEMALTLPQTVHLVHQGSKLDELLDSHR
jgi:hypothetical protein